MCSAQAYGEAIARAARDADAHPTLRLTTNLRLGLEGHEARARTRMKEGDNAFVALSWSKHPAPQTYEEAAEKMGVTIPEDMLAEAEKLTAADAEDSEG